MLLSSTALVAALFAALALAPLASAEPDPLAGGTTTVTLNRGIAKQLKKADLKITATKPGKARGTKLSLPVIGGKVDPTTGAGVITHGGGLKIRAGRRSVKLAAVELNTATKSLSAKLRGRKVKLARLAGLSFTRKGFHTNIRVKKVKLTGAAAKSLNQALARKPRRGAKEAKPVFRGNTVLGSARAATQPRTVTVVPGNSLALTIDPTLLSKLKDVETNVAVIPPTAAANVFSSPIIGGTISPLGTSGVVSSSGALKLVQNSPDGHLPTIFSLGNIAVHLAEKTARVEVVDLSFANSLGRQSFAITVSSVVANPATRTVAVNATAVLTAVSATTLNSFPHLYELNYVKELEQKGATQEAAEAAAAARVAPDRIGPGQALGSFSFTAQAQ